MDPPHGGAGRAGAVRCAGRRRGNSRAHSDRPRSGALMGGLAWYIVGAPTPATAFAVPKDFL